jgi:hypothetical protein
VSVSGIASSDRKNQALRSSSTASAKSTKPRIPYEIQSTRVVPPSMVREERERRAAGQAARWWAGVV